MSLINQNSILNSIHAALVPGASMIDGRTEQDWLRFLSDFAGLINFYDQDNLVHGNWAPFLLKDPVFLMAAISGTKFAKLHTLYLHTCHKLEQLLQFTSDKKDLPTSFNQLFDQLIGIFVKIKQWSHYMQQSALDYPLKTYVSRQIRITFANEFQALLALRTELFLHSIIPGLAAADPLLTEDFERYEARIWSAGEFKEPYWKLMGLLHPIKKNTIPAVFKAITRTGDILFNFLQIIITQASAEFCRLTKLKSNFPDTTLLRTFIHLLKIQQDELNAIAAKHLSFYYKDILKQTKLKAVADRAYIIAGLTAKDATVILPAGTLFDAGTDAEKNPVVFESIEEVILNPAAIPVVYTLSRTPASNDLSSLQLQTIPNPGVVQRDAEGKILSWDTLGSRVSDPSIQQSLGIAFSSPMLLLREGIRNIKFSLGYTGEPDLNMLKQSHCYLSTLNDWFEVAADFQLVDSASAHTIVITINLNNTHPAIERFLVNPDGFTGSWPMFKLVFDQITGSKIPPPVLHSMQIDVKVSGLETFQLYNDYGALSTKVAYPPFGPSPLIGSDFIIGSNEIFSKPLTSLMVQLNWSALPPDFSIYYQAYNLYLNNQLRISKMPEPSWWERLFGKKETVQPVLAVETKPYNNTCFTVNFQVLEEKTWTPVVFDVFLAPSPEPTTEPSSVPPSNASTQPAPTVAPNLLFTENESLLTTLSTYSSTAIPVTACDPDLQNQPVKFTEASSAGFLKMELIGPEYGFGSGIYPNVVSAVTLYNSQILYGNENLAFVDAAQLPFAPKLKSFSADYSASVYYSFDQEVQENAALKDYPVQCFLYAPFGNYMVYDNLNQPPAQHYTIGDSEDIQAIPSGIPLYASFNYEGFLYLSIDSLVPASSFNLYFEMAGKYVTGVAADSKIGYYYLSASGWEPLVVLSDGTNNLTSSGIVNVNVPANITKESNLMPKDSYWMAIVANDISIVASTILLSTNGVSVQRSDAAADVVIIPEIAANTITKTKKPFPKIGIVQQPFPSFNGREAEDVKAMNERISCRLKTKDRAVAAADYFRLIRQEFRFIYDSVSIYNSTEKSTNVYVVKSVDSWMAPNAFLPMIGTSQAEQIQNFLQERTSAFSIVNVANPDFQSVKIYAVISIQPGYEFLTVQQQLIQALNIYLSPWIKDSGAQVEIYQDITNVQVSAFIKTITGVASVAGVSFKTWMYNPAAIEVEKNAVLQPMVKPLEKSALFISNLAHQISLNPSAV